MESARSRSRHIPATESFHLATKARWEALNQLVPAGMPPNQVAGEVFTAIRDDRFYILTHSEGKGAIRTRMEDILQERNPSP
jgi:hypothetical protein